MVHEGDQAKIEQGGIDDEREIIRIPPSIEEIGGERQPGQPKSGSAQREKHREHDQQENQEWPGMEQHLERQSGRGERCGATSAVPAHSRAALTLKTGVLDGHYLVIVK